MRPCRTWKKRCLIGVGVAVEAERWRRVEDLCDRALALDPDERRTFLAAACADDTDLRREVESLLSHESNADGFLRSSMLQAAAHGVMTAQPGALIGRRLGAYDVKAWLGAGGMGDVYHARDTRLGRDVALKVLPPHLADDSERLTRFEREARLLASLNHAHIATLYGVEEAVSSADADVTPTRALILELVEGETLAARLERGALKPDQALAFAIQIADALDHAHRRGVTHRDLKPANVMLTKSGVKLLDFGLAKWRNPRLGYAPVQAVSAGSGVTVPPEFGSVTEEGTILGTLHYMAPEQLETKDVDARADLFAFGAVLFEMLTGQKAFDGGSQATIIAAVLGTEPPALSTLQPLSPPALDHVVTTCLAKDPDERWQTAGDLKRELQWIAGVGSSVGVVAPNVVTRRSRARLSSIALGLVFGGLALGAILWNLVRPSVSEPRPVVQSVIPIAPAEELSWDFESTASPLMAISPDGSRVVYSGSRAGVRQLYLRALDRPEAEAIAGSEGAHSPFFSPDWRWVGFRVGARLMKVALTGGAAVTLCAGCEGMGFSWSSEDTIVLGSGRRGLEAIPAAGGTASQLTAADKAIGERTLRFPEVLPGANAVLFTAGGWEERTFDDARIEVLSLATGQKKVLIEGGTYGRYASSGHLIYARAGSLFAVAFDPVRLEIKGAPVAVLEGVATSPANGAAQFALSSEGTLVYAPGRPMGIHHRLVWVDRRGKVEPLGEIAGAFDSPRLSPDGRRIALRVEGGPAHLEVYDVPRGILTQLTFEENVPSAAAWVPSGRRLAYTWQRTGDARMYWQAADGSGGPEELGQAGSVGSWSPDGKTLVFVRSDPRTQADLWLLPIEGDRTARPLLQERSNQRWPEISPDGRWMAYVSEESGRAEVYVREFPGLGQKTRISGNGGDAPRWSRNGRELFYVEGEYRHGDEVYDVHAQNKLMVSQIGPHPTLAVSKAAIAFEDKAGRYLKLGYDVAPDGRFLLVDENENWPAQLNLVQNWFEELKRRVPTR